MQNPNEDTEWNDVLRSKGILPPKEKEVDEDTIVKLVDDAVSKKLGEKSEKAVEDMTLEELEEMEDEEDERILQQYRDKRIAEMKAIQLKAKYGEVKEISAVDYVDEVNKAGDDVWVVLHLYQQGIPLCSLINQHIQRLARKFPATKFLKSISTTCIPNYPDKNLPTIFVYYEGDMKGQLVGPFSFGGMKLTVEGLEWKLSELGAVKTSQKENPDTKNQIQDMLTVSLKGAGTSAGHRDPDDSDEDDD